MTAEEKVIKNKLGPIKLSKTLRNVSQACKVMGYSRDSFYRFKELYEQGGELAPRIKALFEKKAELERAKTEAEEALKYHTIELASPAVVREYVQSMRDLLEESSIVRRKAFLRSFLDRIEVDKSWAKFTYTWPPDDPPA